MFFRVCRGMLPHKTARGASALARLRVYEGIPPEYSRKKRMVVPDALRVLRHTPGRKVTQLGLLAKEVGWKYADTVEAFEIKRKRNSLRFYKKKLANRKSLLASRSVINNKISNKLENFGY
jgi:large subunit ribosomal protein L13Ae